MCQLEFAAMHLDSPGKRPTLMAKKFALDQVLAGLEGAWIEDARRAQEELCLAALECETRALIGVDELHARTEARYSGPMKRVAPDEEL